jgi:hypothetical protein
MATVGASTDTTDLNEMLKEVPANASEHSSESSKHSAESSDSAVSERPSRARKQPQRLLQPENKLRFREVRQYNTSRNREAAVFQGRKPMREADDGKARVRASFAVRASLQTGNYSTPI